MPAETNAETSSVILRLYEVTFSEWGAPVTVVAPDFKLAAQIATNHRGAKRDALSMFVLDATDAWQGLSKTMDEHIQQAIAAGNTGIAVYDEDDGWAVEVCRS